MILTKEIKIEEGADAGKVFIVSQMPLIKGDRWANRAALAVMKAGVDVAALKGLTEKADGNITGMLDIASVLNVLLKALGGIEEATAQALLDELLDVVKIQLPDGGERKIIAPTEHSNGDINDMKTLWKIRIEAIKVNLDFLKAGVFQ